MAREVRPIPATSASRAPRAARAAPTRTSGTAQGFPVDVTTSTSGGDDVAGCLRFLDRLYDDHVAMLLDEAVYHIEHLGMSVPDSESDEGSAVGS